MSFKPRGNISHPLLKTIQDTARAKGWVAGTKEARMQTVVDIAIRPSNYEHTYVDREGKAHISRKITPKQHQHHIRRAIVTESLTGCSSGRGMPSPLTTLAKHSKAVDEVKGMYERMLKDWERIPPEKRQISLPGTEREGREPLEAISFEVDKMDILRAQFSLNFAREKYLDRNSLFGMTPTVAEQSGAQEVLSDLLRNAKTTQELKVIHQAYIKSSRLINAHVGFPYSIPVLGLLFKAVATLWNTPARASLEASYETQFKTLREQETKKPSVVSGHLKEATLESPGRAPTPEQASSSEHSKQERKPSR